MVEYERAPAKTVARRIAVAVLLASVLVLIWWGILSPFFTR